METLYSNHEVIELANKLLRFIVTSSGISWAAARANGVDVERNFEDRRKALRSGIANELTPEEAAKAKKNISSGWFKRAKKPN